MLPLQCDLQLPNARHKSITHAPAAERNLNATIPLRSAETELKIHNRISHSGNIKCSPKTESTHRRFWSTFQKEFLKGKSSSAPKWNKNLLPKQHSKLSCCHYNTIYNSQTQGTRVLRMHPQQRETLTQPFHCDLQRLSSKCTIEFRTTAT